MARESDGPRTEEITLEFTKAGVRAIKRLIQEDENEDLSFSEAVECLAQMGALTMRLINTNDLRHALKINSMAAVQKGQVGEVLIPDLPGVVVLDLRELFDE